MAVDAKKLDVREGDIVEIDGHRYEIVLDKRGGLALEAAITVSADELHRERDTRPATAEEIADELGALPTDREG